LRRSFRIASVAVLLVVVAAVFVYAGRHSVPPYDANGRGQLRGTVTGTDVLMWQGPQAESLGLQIVVVRWRLFPLMISSDFALETDSVVIIEGREAPADERWRTLEKLGVPRRCTVSYGRRRYSSAESGRFELPVIERLEINAK
jgi:hypothetical protein